MSVKRKFRKKLTQESFDTYITKHYKTVSHLIFDCDGTLLDTETIRRKAITKCVSKRQRSISEETLHKILGRTDLDAIKIVISETEIDELPVLLLKEFLKECRTELPFCQKKSGAEMIVKHFHSHGVPMAVATSSSVETMNLKTKHHIDFFRLFDFIMLAGTDRTIKKGKPAPDIYLQTAINFHSTLPPDKCLVFEDSPSGVGAAIAAGMQVVMIPDPKLDPSLSTDATLVLTSLSEFVPHEFGLPDFKF